jgi:hypothetical protein
MHQSGEMATSRVNGGADSELRERIEFLAYANKTLMHELAAVKLERARVRAELELAERRAAGLEQVCVADSVIAAEQRSVANRLERRLDATKGVMAAATLAGFALACRRALALRHERGPGSWLRRLSAAL